MEDNCDLLDKIVDFEEKRKCLSEDINWEVLENYDNIFGEWLFMDSFSWKEIEDEWEDFVCKIEGLMEEME